MPNRSADERVGTLFAYRYELEALLGEGAMGAVYRARHVRIGRMLAIKVLHRRLAAPKVIQRFEREAELAGKLQHPNVVPVVDLDTTDGGDTYLVMDFVEGATLSELLPETPMPAERVIWLARQLCDGLEHAHGFGLVHRDFKPENVIVTRDSRGFELPRIVDFGVAILREEMRAPTGGNRLTTDGMVVGTPHYMSPEQVRGEPIDARSDLFALGIMLYELLTGKLPFDGDGAEVARANLNSATPPMGTRVPTVEVDPLLEAVVARLLEKDRAARPQSAREVRELLELIETDRIAAMAALGIEAPAPAPAPAPVPAPAPAPLPPEPRRDFITGRKPRAQAPAWHRTAALAALAVMFLVMVIALVRKPHEVPAAPPPSPPPPRIVTVPVPMPIEHAAPDVPEPAPPTAPRRRVASVAPVPAAPPVPASPQKSPPRTSDISSRYREVGQLLHTHGSDELWQRYRWIRLGDCLQSADKRAECSRMLDAIASDAARK